LDCFGKLIDLVRKQDINLNIILVVVLLPFFIKNLNLLFSHQNLHFNCLFPIHFVFRNMVVDMISLSFVIALKLIFYLDIHCFVSLVILALNWFRHSFVFPIK